MNPWDLGRSYDSIATKWRDGEYIQINGLSQAKRALQFCKTRGHALDAGCGCSGRFEDLLIEQGFQIEGVDVSEQMIALARVRCPGVTFHHADLTDWKLPRKYDFITAWDSIWHLPLASQEPVMRKLMDGLAPEGVFIFTVGGLDDAGEKSDSAMGPPVYYSTLGIPGFLALIADCGCVCRHLEFDQFPEQHLYIIAQKRA